MTSQTQPPEHQYPLPGTPTDPIRIDFNAVGKEIANDLAVSAFIDNLTNEDDKDIIREQLERHLECSDSVIESTLSTGVYERIADMSHKPTVKKYFEKHLKIILLGLK